MSERKICIRSSTKPTWLLKCILDNDFASITSYFNPLTVRERYDIVSMRHQNGQSMLHFAAHHGRLEIVRYFAIECLKNVNTTYSCDLLDTTPLFIAIRRGDYLMVRLLVKLGANLSWQNRYAENAMVYACKHQQLRICLYLKNLGCHLDTDRNVRLCADSLKYCLVSLLLGTSVNATDSKHDSIFILAAELANLDVLKLLIYKGVNIRYRNRSLDNALSAALWKLQMRSYGFLIHCGIYTLHERAMALELAGAKMILFQSNYQQALDMWIFSLQLRLSHVDGMSEKLDYYYKKRITPIKEFQSALDIARIRENADACIEQAHLVYTRIRDISIWERTTE